MLKKCAILGLAVLLVGGLAFGWLYNETQNEQRQADDLKARHSRQGEEYLSKYSRWHLLSPEEQTQLVLEMDKDRQTKSGQQLHGEQQARLMLDMEKLAAGQVSSGQIADFLYGSGWEEEVLKYKKRQEQKEIAHTTSIVCISIGGAIFGGCLLIWFLYGSVWLVRTVAQWRSRTAKRTKTESTVPELTEIHTAAPTEDADASDAVHAESPPEEPSPAASIPPGSDRPGSSPFIGEGFLPRSLGVYASSRRPTLASRKAATVVIEEDPMDVLMSDEVSDRVWSPDVQWSAGSAPDSYDEDIVDAPQFSRPATATLVQEDRAPDVSSTLREQAEDLQKQLAELKQAAQNVQQASRGQSDPVNSTLKELAQQVSAIRDYAASQQDRVEKLQDGYDWGIIRTFCLRVIRCIDNVEKRIEDLGQEDEIASYLQEIRDELLFALESSSVEQFPLEVNSEYRGQEKLAEAVKEKQPTNKPDLAGKIAKVLRPGYRYIIDDDNFKIVRTAQVKLFG
jgi:molecular chaperone GrpE (heat shock protein)